MNALQLNSKSFLNDNGFQPLMLQKILEPGLLGQKDKSRAGAGNIPEELGSLVIQKAKMC